jgi:hypothetical protein
VMVGSGTGSTTTMGSSVAIANLRVRNDEIELWMKRV